MPLSLNTESLNTESAFLGSDFSKLLKFLTWNSLKNSNFWKVTFKFLWEIRSLRHVKLVFLAVHPWLKSTHLIENFISLLREFGFLHFCSDLFFQDKSGYGLYAVPDLDVLSDRSRFHWWRGYSPYDVDHSDQGWPLPAKDSLKNVKKTRKKVLLL